MRGALHVSAFWRRSDNLLHDPCLPGEENNEQHVIKNTKGGTGPSGENLGCLRKQESLQG